MADFPAQGANFNTWGTDYANFFTNTYYLSGANGGKLKHIIDVDTIITVRTSGGDYTTVPLALASLKGKWINDDVTVTIEVEDGTFNHTAAIVPKHPCGGRISIVGTNTYVKSLTSIQSSSGSAGAWSIILNLNNVTDIATNDYVLIRATSGGTLPEYLQGAHKVTNVDSGNGRITVASKHKNASAPSGAVVSSSVTVVKTILTFTGGIHGIAVGAPYTLGNLDKVVLEGGAASGYHGIITGIKDGTTGSIGGSIYCGTTVGVVNFNRGMLALNGEIAAAYCMASGNTGIGFSATQEGYLEVPYSVSSGNSSDGFNAYQGGTVTANNSVSTGNSLQGFYNGIGCFLNANTCVSAGNLANGFLTEFGGSMEAISASSINNTVWGYYTGRRGYMLATSSTASGNGSGSYSPSVDTQGNEYAYIDT